jgi:hypothetical protein
MSSDHRIVDSAAMELQSQLLMKEREKLYKNSGFNLPNDIIRKGASHFDSNSLSNTKRDADVKPKPSDSSNQKDSVQHTINLPGAGDRHRILTLSDEDYRSLPINVMMGWYGEASGGGTCTGMMFMGIIELLFV